MVGLRLNDGPEVKFKSDVCFRFGPPWLYLMFSLALTLNKFSCEPFSVSSFWVNLIKLFFCYDRLQWLRSINAS